MVLLIFQGHPVAATSPTGSEYNHALASNGGQATASGSSGSNAPETGLVGAPPRTCRGSRRPGCLPLQSDPWQSVTEIHLHSPQQSYPPCPYTPTPAGH